MAAVKKVEWIWTNGKLVKWDDANEHVLAHTLHYGLGAFEGIRSYARADGSASIFRLGDHIDRLFESCHIATLDIPFTRADLRSACLAVLRENKLRGAYIRPLVYLGFGALGLGTTESPVKVVVAAYEWIGAYTGDESLRLGIRAMVSSFRRGAVDATMAKGKLCGQYVGSVLAKREASRLGLDEAILLDPQGHVAEATGQNVFIVKRGVLITPPLSTSILAGITRDTVLRLANDLGIETRSSLFARDELWCADEVFLCGTAAEVTPVREVDGRRIGGGEPGPATRRLQEAFFDAVRGPKPRYPDWLTPV